MLVIGSIVLYVVAVGWVFLLHPLVSVSTGEPKPRSLFVDEHALPVHSTIIENTINSFESGSIKGALCDSLLNLGADCIEINSTIVTQVNPIQVPFPREQILLGLILPTNSSNLSSFSIYKSNGINLLWNIVKKYREAKWNAKQLKIIATSSLETLNSVLNSTLIQRPFVNSPSLVRECYVLDLSDLEDSFQWEEITLVSHDTTGAQPNMDMISYLIHLHPFHGLQLPKCPFGSMVYVFSDFLVDLLLPWEKILRGHSAASKLSMQRRIDGYLHQLCTRVVGLSSIDSSKNYHQQVLKYFLQQNVDAIALLFQRNKLSSIQRNEFPRKRVATGEVTLLQFIFDLIYGSNYLEEELHHSYFHYILMGEQTFVGMNEFAIPGMLIVLSFFMFAMSFLHYSVASKEPQQKDRILVGHQVPASSFMTALVLLAIRYRLSTLLALLCPYMNSNSVLLETAIVIMSWLYLYFEALYHNQTEENMEISDIRDIWRMTCGIELLFSVVLPLLFTGIRDIASLYVFAALLYPVIFLLTILCHGGFKLMNSQKRFLRVEQETWLLVLGLLLAFFRVVGKSETFLSVLTLGSHATLRIYSELSETLLHLLQTLSLTAFSLWLWHYCLGKWSSYSLHATNMKYD